VVAAVADRCVGCCDLRRLRAAAQGLRRGRRLDVPPLGAWRCAAGSSGATAA